MNDTENQKGSKINGVEEIIGLKGAQFDYAIGTDGHTCVMVYTLPGGF